VADQDPDALGAEAPFDPEGGCGVPQDVKGELGVRHPIHTPHRDAGLNLDRSEDQKLFQS
jgi:hypothetical protein